MLPGMRQRSRVNGRWMGGRGGEMEVKLEVVLLVAKQRDLQ